MTRTFIDIATVDFKCPNCDKEYRDDDDVYLNRCNKNKSGYTRIKCECEYTFGMTYHYHGAVSFEIKKIK